jgi:epoxyqueuosine reductase
MISEVNQIARMSGFVSIGFSKPGKPLYLDYFKKWISAGRHGEMGWLERNLDIRENPALLLPGCRTIISLAWPYSARKPSSPDGFTASRYSSPDSIDYHELIKSHCRELVGFINKSFPGAKTRVCVDSAPILERSFALAGGVGFIGKNTLLIVPDHGSYVFLAEILTTVDLPIPTRHAREDMCGDCNLCMLACPTGALRSPYELDASRCLSYLTIEWGGEISRETGQRMGDCFLGCDRCQEVCPHNGYNKPHLIVLPSSKRFLSMEKGEFQRQYGHTAFARAGLKKIRSNLKAMGVQDG